MKLIARNNVKTALFLAMLTPLFWLIYQAVFAQELLGADPAKALVHQSGLWAIRAILLALAVTPLRILSKQSSLIKYRRMLGLFAFFYAALHFIIYIALFLQFDFIQIGKELTKRPYIIVGFIALLLYIPLAVTSTTHWQRRLKRRWAKLHQLVYAIGILAIIHFTWSKKLGIVSTWLYVLILFILLLVRIINKININRKLQQFKIN